MNYFLEFILKNTGKNQLVVLSLIDYKLEITIRFVDVANPTINRSVMESIVQIDFQIEMHQFKNQKFKLIKNKNFNQLRKILGKRDTN